MKWTQPLWSPLVQISFYHHRLMRKKSFMWSIQVFDWANLARRISSEKQKRQHFKPISVARIWHLIRVNKKEVSAIHKNHSIPFYCFAVRYFIHHCEEFAAAIIENTPNCLRFKFACRCIWKNELIWTNSLHLRLSVSSMCICMVLFKCIQKLYFPTKKNSIQPALCYVKRSSCHVPKVHDAWQ